MAPRENAGTWWIGDVEIGVDSWRRQRLRSELILNKVQRIMGRDYGNAPRGTRGVSVIATRLACFVAAISAGMSGARAELIDPARHTETGVTWEIGEMEGDPIRNLVYILKIKENAMEILALNTETGRVSARAPLAGHPRSIAFSVDGSKVYVSLPSVARIQILTAGTLTTLDVLDTAVTPGDIELDAAGYIYTSVSDYLVKLDPVNGDALWQGGDRYYPGPLLCRDLAGTRLFVMERGLSGGSASVDEFLLPTSPGDGPSFVRDHFNGKSNDRHLTFDHTINTLFRSSGGVYGLGVWNLDSSNYAFWPFTGGAAYGVAVAQLPGDPYVYAASGDSYDGRIVKYRKSDGIPVYSYRTDTSSPTGIGLEGYADVMSGRLAISPNCHLVYGKDDDRIGLIGGGTINLAVTETGGGGAYVYAGGDRGAVAGTPLPLSADFVGGGGGFLQWSRVSGPGNVEFGNANAISTTATFLIPGEYVVRAESSVGSDQFAVEVGPPASGEIFGEAEGVKFKIPYQAGDLTDAGGRAWCDPDFDDSEWGTGPQGIGYDRGGGTPSFQNHIATDTEASGFAISPSILVRVPLAADPGQYQSISLNVRYDDGVAIYLNGQEVARSNVVASGSLPWDALALGDRSRSAAVTPAVFDLTPHLHLLQTGGNVLAIQSCNDAVASPEHLLSFSLDATPSITDLYYRDWTQAQTGTAMPSGTSRNNTDADARIDLLEYGFGGLVDQPDSVRDGVPLDPVCEVRKLGPNNFLYVSYRRRTDAAERGLGYNLRFSRELDAGSWRAMNTAGFDVIELTPTPLEDGFELASYRLAAPLTGNAVFAQVEVTLAP